MLNIFLCVYWLFVYVLFVSHILKSSVHLKKKILELFIFLLSLKVAYSFWTLTETPEAIPVGGHEA